MGGYIDVKGIFVIRSAYTGARDSQMSLDLLTRVHVTRERRSARRFRSRDRQKVSRDGFECSFFAPWSSTLVYRLLLYRMLL